MAGVADESFSRDLDLTTLLDGISYGSIALPNFQRDFDWRESDVLSLLATVLSGWPAGSLLLMSGDPSFFKVREFESAPPLRRSGIEYVVLDGQQRLTSLYHAFRGAGEKVYAINTTRALRHPITAETIEDALVSLTVEEARKPQNVEAFASGRLVALSVATNPAEYYEWRDELVEALPAADRPAASRDLAALYKHVLSHAHRYKFPSMLLDKRLQPEAVARIFERINKTGMRLSTFDLLVARSYTSDWNLREVWEAAREERPNLDLFVGEDGLAVAQAIALRSPARDVRQPAVLGLSPERVQTQWETQVDAVDRAASFLVRHGCLDNSWLPYKTQLLPLAALAVDHDLDEHSELLLAWLWGSSFALSYDVASSTVASEDYLRLKDAIASRSVIPGRYVVSRSRIGSATRANSGALWRAFRWLLLSRAARDIVTGTDLSRQPGSELSMVSVLPRVVGGGETPPHLLVLGQALSEKAGVSRLRARPLGLRGPEEVSADGLISQLFPTDTLEDYLFDWRKLIEVRRDRLEAFLRESYQESIEFVD